MPDHVHLVLMQGRRDVEQIVIQLKGAATEQLVEEGIHPFQNILVNKSAPLRKSSASREESAPLRKSSASRLTKTGRRPKCFARGEWKVFLDPEDVPRAIRYVENNPVKEGKPPQRWTFVTPVPG